MNFTREDLLELWTALTIASNQTGSTNYNYAVAKNLSLLESDAKAVQSAITPNKRFSEWDSKRSMLCQKWSDRDLNNQPVKDSGKYVISGTNFLEFEKEMAELNKEYAADIEHQNEKNYQDTEFLRQKIDFPEKLVSIPQSDIPKELSGRVLRPLLPIITD